MICTIFSALSSIASEQTIATKTTMRRVIYLLDYSATHPDAVIMFRASDMVLNVHSDASFLSKKKAKSRMVEYFSWDIYLRRTRIFSSMKAYMCCVEYSSTTVNRT